MRLPFVETPRERSRRLGRCTGPHDGGPVPGEVGLDYRAPCRTCGKRVAITVRGLYAHHRPEPAKIKPAKRSLRLMCTGCDRLWNSRDSKGRCSRCKRCLSCCGFVSIKYTCSWRAARRTPEQLRHSNAAYKRWQDNPSILGHNRRIT